MNQKKFAFVLMPFVSAFDDVYKFGIKQACDGLNIYCERVDEQIFHEGILDRILNQIAKADLLIADMSTQNANVFYEVGYAHGIGRNVILVTQQAKDIPFDFKHFPHIIYGNSIETLNTELKRKLEFFSSSASSEELRSLFEFELEAYFFGKRITPDSIFSLNHNMISYNSNTKIDIYNNSNKIWRTPVDFAIETSNDFAGYFGRIPTILPNGNVLIKLGHISTLYPKAWGSFSFLISHDGNFSKTLQTPAIFKIFAPHQSIDIPITLEIVKQPIFNY
jgi:hypothetical protein